MLALIYGAKYYNCYRPFIVACDFESMSDDDDHEKATEAHFAQRVGKLRARFPAKLFDKIAQANAALPQMRGDGIDAIDAVATTYRQFHDVCGIAPIIGFPATGELARLCDIILVTPFRDQRGLSAIELSALTDSIESLRVGALTEMPSLSSDRS